MTSQIQVNLNLQSISQQTHAEVAGQLQGPVKKMEEWVGPPMAGMILPLGKCSTNAFLKIGSKEKQSNTTVTK